MIAVRPDPQPSRPRRRRSPGRLLLLATCAVSLLLTPGCGGCLRRAEKTDEQLLKEEEERQKKLEEEKSAKEKPPLETKRVLSQPNDGAIASCWCKPGHWTAVTVFGAKANHNDFDGELELGVVDPRGNPVGLDGMAYTLSALRPAPLPKGQPKSLEALLFVPGSFRQGKALTRLRERRTGRLGLESTDPIAQMQPYQYHFVVLARLPGSYAFLKDLTCLRNPVALTTTEPARLPYRLTFLAGDQPTWLPGSGLYWTSTAYLLWDDADPMKLVPEQQIALLDWLHWGGQLIVNGPDSVDGLAPSFLGPYLPAKSSGRRELTAQNLLPLSECWRRTGQRVGTPLIPADAWSGVTLEKHPEARFVPGTGDLVVERRVGRGRIVMTAFPLTIRQLTGWKSFDNFFNACLLGRPPRHFYESDRFTSDSLDSTYRVTWADAAPSIAVRSGPGGVDTSGWGPAEIAATDPARICKLRYFTRDSQRSPAAGTPASSPTASMARGASPFAPTIDDAWDGTEHCLPDVGSWRDFNSVAAAARTTLQNAARIEVPDPKFVLWVLGGYLVVLVPVNWAFFRLLGRVEWAWVAAPVIAIVCTVVVIRLARLDIGFARSMSEIAVVECQGDYQRAHVTRYTALYSSLYTNYRVEFDDAGGQVQPFPTVKDPGEFRFSLGETSNPLKHRQGVQSALEGFFVRSNTTNFLHSEQMVDLGGPLRLARTPDGHFQLTNGTNLTLRGAGVLRNNASAQPAAPGPAPAAAPARQALEAAWLDAVEPGASVPVRFQPAPKDLWSAQRNRALPTAENAPQGELSLRALLAVAEDAAELEPGEVRLVGWVDQQIAGQTIEPAAPQARRLALVVAHLRYGPGHEPQSDISTLEQTVAGP